MYKLVLSTTLLFVWLMPLLTSCQSQNKKSANKNQLSPNEPKTVLIYLRRGACMGRCPAYEAWFYADNTMEYYGKAHMPVTGRYSYILPKEMIKNLLIEAKNKKIKNAESEYPGPPDAPAFEIKVLLDGQLKTIYSHGDAPECVKDYLQLLHNEVKAMVTEQQGIPLPEKDEAK